jgi:adenylate cyclase class 2
MIEAELKARVTDPEQVHQRLVARAPEHRSVYHDTYFDRPDRSITDAGRELRVRVMEQEGRRRCLLTFKDAAVDEASGSKPEHETEIGDAGTVELILRALGLEPVIAFTKQCANFTFDLDRRQVLATLVRVPELAGTWLEVETLVEDQTALELALGVVHQVLGELGILEADLTTELYTDMVAHQRANSGGRAARPSQEP